MPKFKVLAGMHAEQGRTWDAGQVIETDKDLVRMLGPEKFQLVGDDFEAHPGTPRDGLIAAPFSSVEQNEIGSSRETARRAREQQSPADKKAAKAARKAEAKAAKARKSGMTPEPEDDEDDEEESSEYESVDSELGNDVTDEWDEAQEKNLHVFKRGAYYYVAKQDDPETQVNEKGLKDKDLKKFLKNYDPDEEEEEEEEEEEDED